MKLFGFKIFSFLTGLLVAVFCTVKVIANEAAKPPAKSEEKSINQYLESITVLNVQLEKIRENKERIERLIEEKNRTGDRSRVIEIIAEINMLEQQNKKTYAEARKLQYDLRYMYPEKGEETARLYKRHGLEDLSEKEEISFSERIGNVLSYAKKVYGPTQAEISAAEAAIRKKQEEEAKKANDPKSRFERIKVSK